MFIDISTYIGHWPFRNLRYNTLEALDLLAQKYEITHMVVSNLNGLFYKDANTGNLELIDELNSYEGKTTFLPMAIVNPTYPDWESDAREMIKRDFAGFELAPIYHGYSLAPEMLYDEYMPKHRAKWVIDLAEELDVPVRICSGFENFRGRSSLDNYSNISGEDYYSLLSTNDKVHVFTTSFSPFTAGEHFGALIRERKNTYFDTTQFETLNTNAGAAMQNILSKEQLCFGSLSPFNYMEANLIRMEYTPEFDADTMKTNAARAFKALR